MNDSHRFTLGSTKIIASLMTIVFSFVAFAYGQSCTLLPGWTPSVLADGQSRTGYQINEATYTQSCTGSVGTITCISGTVAYGNIFKYPSCIPHTWANCTTPTGANHLQYKTLYRAGTASYTQTCQQLSQNLQCLNGVFTGGISPNLFTFASCVDPNRAQCIDSRTSSYRDHGETLVGYTATSPGIGQTCSTLERSLVCTNGVWSGNGSQGQAGLVTSCTNPPAFSGCLNIRTNTLVPHGGNINAYTYPTGICTGLSQPLSCVNGVRSGGNQISLYSGCLDVNTQSCPNILTNSGTLPHGTFLTKYTQPFAFEVNNQYCTDFIKTIQCANGIWLGNDASLTTGCQNVSTGSCFDASTNTYTPNFQFITKYTLAQANATTSCTESQQQFTCRNGVRSGGNPSNYPIAMCYGCTLPPDRGIAVAEGWQGIGYSVTGAVFPKTCEQDYSAPLSCANGILNGNWQTYQYADCTDIGGLVQGIDLAIDESPGIPGQENLSGGIIAQGSSPQLTILFKNKGTDIVNQAITDSGFLSCVRTEQNLPVYTSNPITSFVVNPATKVGVNIRIKSLFTQALGTKTLECTIDTSMINGNVVIPGNDVRSRTFEIVQADRFDLALSKSIESISQNLEAAEGAKGVQGAQNFLFNTIMNVLVPLVIILGILSAILGFYKIMFSSDDKATSEGTRYIIFGVIGIILIMSAKFIGQNVFDLLVTPESGTIKGYEIASGLYDKILYPFIKLAIYLVLGAMFVILVSRVITFLFGSDSDAQKKAGTLIGWNVIAMLVIIGAKQIVQAIYGKQADVVKDITNLGEVGSGILADKNIPILYQVINYALGIASLVILVIIIIQTVKLLMKPDDPAQIKNIKNSLLYMFIGILILGAGYLIVNFAIIN